MGIKRLSHVPLFAFLISISSFLNALGESQTIESEMLFVEVDPLFPRVLQYRWKASGALLYGQEESLKEVAINGTTFTPQVSFSKTGSAAHYVLSFPSIAVTVAASFEAIQNVLHFRITEIQERGDFKIKTFEIPNHGLLSVRSTQKGAQVTAARVWPPNNSNEEFIPLSEKEVDKEPVPRTVIILNTGELAASMANNVLLDSARMVYQTVGKADFKVCRVWNPAWTYREIDTEIVELPYASISVTASRNGDGVVDWQDGALALRQIMVHPPGSDRVKKVVASQIAMNFASWAQHPFLRVLDNIKMIYLFTDGLGQDVQFKGYQSEGHDSAHPDYGNHFNERAGGLKDLNFVLERLGKYNCWGGVHINATEYYPEAKYFSYDLVDMKKPGWAWLDQSYLTDKRYDILSGKLFRRLDELKENVPRLTWIYVDVYFGVGWDAWKLARKLHQNGWTVYTEFESIFERDATWIHRSQKPAGLGIKGKVFRFIRNHEQDVWVHHPMLRGSYNLGFMGWHTERDVTACIRNIFVHNLPTKYMQHFPILRWQDDRIDMEGSVHVEMEGDRVTLYRNGKIRGCALYRGKRLLAEENRLFIPWDPLEETRIYHWNDGGGETTWDLPGSWCSSSQVTLYELTRLGRVFLRRLPVHDGKVTLYAKANTPYVIYKDEPPPSREILWGEGSLAKDPGFDSQGFNYWTKTSSFANTDHVKIVQDSNGQTHLRVHGNGGADAVIHQILYGLKGGHTYSASAWVELKGERTASIGLRAYQAEETGESGFFPEVSSSVSKTNVRNYGDNCAKYMTFYQRFKVLFDVPKGHDKATLYVKAGRGASDSIADFDDVRVVEAVRTDPRGHDFFEDFENVDEGWGPFVYAYQGTMHTHLSELREGYTRDTIDGRFSLKTKDEEAGLVYRTLPVLLKLAPNTTYALSFDYLQDNDEQYSVAVRTDEGGAGGESIHCKLPGKNGERHSFSQIFTTGNWEDSYVGMIKNNREKGVLVIDNFAIDQVKGEARK